MNILVSFRPDSMLSGLSRFEGRGMVRVVITLVCQWLLNNQQQGRDVEWVLENIHKAVDETYVHAEYLLSTTVEIDNRTGNTRPIRYPTVASVTPGINYNTIDNHMQPEQWYMRYCELVEHLLIHYARPVMGFYQAIQDDKHINNVQCLAFTDYHITLVASCYNLIEYQAT